MKNQKTDTVRRSDMRALSACLPTELYLKNLRYIEALEEVARAANAMFNVGPHRKFAGPFPVDSVMELRTALERITQRPERGE